MKTCSKCKIEKDLENFRNRSDHKHLKKSSCKNCEAAYAKLRNESGYNRKRYAENEKIRIQSLLRNKKRFQVSPEKVKAELKRHQQKHRDKYLARQDLRRSIARGKIIKPKCCQICNIEANRIEGHHTDYSKRLEVIWMCVDCHKKEHGKL